MEDDMAPRSTLNPCAPAFVPLTDAVAASMHWKLLALDAALDRERTDHLIATAQLHARAEILQLDLRYGNFELEIRS